MMMAARTQPDPAERTAQSAQEVNEKKIISYQPPPKIFFW